MQLIHIYHPLKDLVAKNFHQGCGRHYIPLSLSFFASYVSAMVPVKSPKEYYVQQEVIVLFCETVERWVYRGTKILKVPYHIIS